MVVCGDRPQQIVQGDRNLLGVGGVRWVPERLASSPAGYQDFEFPLGAWWCHGRLRQRTPGFATPWPDRRDYSSTPSTKAGIA